MSKIKGIYAAGMSVLNDDLSLNVEKTILHSERIIEQGCHGAVSYTHLRAHETPEHLVFRIVL